MKKIIAMFTAILMMISVFGTVSAFADNSIPTLGYTNVIAESEFANGVTLASSEYDMKKVTDYTFNQIVSAPYENVKYGDVVEMYSGLSYVENSATKYYDNFLRFTYKNVNPDYDGANVPNAEKKASLNYIKLEMDICFEDLLNGNVQIINHAGANDRDTYELLKFRNTGKATFLNSVTFDYEADTWYNVTVYMDLKANVYTAYVNDELKAENAKILTDAIVSSLGKANAFIGFGFALNGQETASKVYIDNMKYSAVEPPVNGGLFMTEMGTGNKRLNYLSLNQTTLNQNVTNTIFDGKTVIENAASVESSVWQTKSNVSYTISDATVNSSSKGKVIKFTNKNSTSEYTDAFLAPVYSFVNTSSSQSTLLNGDELAKHQNVVAKLDICISDYNKFSITSIAHNSSAARKSFEIISFDASGNVKIGSENVASYKPNTWYSYVLSMDYVNSCYKAWMIEDGKVTTLTENGTINADYKYGLCYRVGFGTNTTDCTLEIDDISYRSGNANLSSTIPYSGKKLIGAAYNGGALASVETATIGSAEYDLASVGFASGADKYGMIWDSFGTMLPAIAKTPLN